MLRRRQGFAGTGRPQPHEGGPPSLPAVAGTHRARRRPPGDRHRTGVVQSEAGIRKCRQTGLVGIPRNELLAHLHDAADALDYISQQFSLQHLNVKPENLLLVGGRIKVADFGLVKDLQDVNSSIVGGMTPVYAAPELFDGRPSIHSDQYSLAIVYQEMLTGLLPYEGRTTAQLAAQHMHSRPKLDRLPAADEPTIARALAKDPDQRFSSCRDMIEALMDAGSGPRQRTARAAPTVGTRCPPRVENIPAGPRVDTEVVSRDDIFAARAAAGGPPCNQTQLTEAPLPVRNLPPLVLEPSETRMPTDNLPWRGRPGGADLAIAPSADRVAVRRSSRAAGLAVPARRDRRGKPENGHRLRPCRLEERFGRAAAAPPVGRLPRHDGRPLQLVEPPLDLQHTSQLPDARAASLGPPSPGRQHGAGDRTSDPRGPCGRRSGRHRGHVRDNRFALPQSVAAGVHRLLDHGGNGQRDGAGPRLHRPPGVARAPASRRRGLRPAGALHRPQSADPRTYHGQCLFLARRIEPLRGSTPLFPWRSAGRPGAVRGGRRAVQSYVPGAPRRGARGRRFHGCRRHADDLPVPRLGNERRGFLRQMPRGGGGRQVIGRRRADVADFWNMPVGILAGRHSAERRR